MKGRVMEVNRSSMFLCKNQLYCVVQQHRVCIPATPSQKMIRQLTIQASRGRIIYHAIKSGKTSIVVVQTGLMQSGRGVFGNDVLFSW